MTMNFKVILAVSAAFALCGLQASLPAQADPQDHGHDRANGHDRGNTWAPDRGAHQPMGRSERIVNGRGEVLDSRYQHGRYYPERGYFRSSMPDGYRPYFYRGSRYYFYGGAWYAPRGSGFVVVGAPIGLVVSVLPPYYSTVWIGGLPYYYADDVYYSWDPGQNGYAVVDPPPGADQPSAPPAEAAADLIIYPKNGQNADQQAADRFECHRWAKSQTGFDPTQPDGDVAPADAANSRSSYNRAMSACLQARGYEVK